MVDVLVVLVVLGFFGLAVLYVRLCDRIVGPDPASAGAGDVGGSTDGSERADRAVAA